MSFASTCSLNLGLCLQSEELKHSHLTFFSSSDVFQVPLKTSPERNIKEMQSRAAEQIHQWRWKPVPKDLMNSRVEGYEQIWAAHSSGLLLRMYFCIFFIIWRGNSPLISCVGDSRAGQGSEHRLVCLSLGSVTCCGKEWVWHKQSASELQ